MSLSENLDRIRNSIEKRRAALGLNYPVTIIAVTKTLPAAVVSEAVYCGLSEIGENRVQEAESKFAELSGLDFTRHLIGHLQENKANKAAALFDWVQSVDSQSLALRLSRKCAELGRTLNICLEVNTSREKSKNGVEPDNAAELCAGVLELPGLVLKGLMTIGPLEGGEQGARAAFSELRRLRDSLENRFRDLKLPVLSMGMSDDYLTAIDEGSTMVRLGRVLFGERG